MGVCVSSLQRQKHQNYERETFIIARPPQWKPLLIWNKKISRNQPNELFWIKNQILCESVFGDLSPKKSFRPGTVFTVTNVKNKCAFLSSKGSFGIKKLIWEKFPQMFMYVSTSEKLWKNVVGKVHIWFEKTYFDEKVHSGKLYKIKITYLWIAL